MSPLKIRLKILPCVVAFLVLSVATSIAQVPGGTLSPLTIPKYVDPLPIPSVMPKTSSSSALDYYEIAIRQFEQQVLSTTSGLPKTKVWSYGSVNHPGTFFYPAFTIEASVDKPVQVKWINQLVVDPVACAASAAPATDPACNHLPHLLPVDRTLHWANPEQLTCAGGGAHTDCRPDPANGSILQQPYDGPVPMVTHLHGAHVNPDSDGYPEAWWLPAANDTSGYAIRGAHFGQIPGAALEDGAALFQYRNDQRATTLWYHDHSLGMTRTNVYAGPAGFYILRGGSDDLPSGVTGGLPGGTYEIPIVIQDRSFNADGSLFYPTSRAFFDGFLGPYIGDPIPSDVSPLHNPEFFGNTMVVNGKTWPYLNVEPRKYRLRFLNGCDSRFLILKFSDKKINFTQIGSEGGFLPKPVVLNQILLALAERADVIVDFAALPPGTKVQLLNVGPDEPFGGNFPTSLKADPATTGQVMEFRVVPLDTNNPDTSSIPTLPNFTPLPNPDSVRQVSLNELDSSLVCWNGVNAGPGTPPNCPKGFFPAGPVSALLGTVDPVTGLGIPQMWGDGITENPALNSVEVWEISNFTADAHPIHIHMVMFQVVSRQRFGKKARPPEAWETGFKDTVVAYPGEITSVKARYDIPGLFVWHCHILSHEDNEMMRPYQVGP